MDCQPSIARRCAAASAAIFGSPWMIGLRVLLVLLTPVLALWLGWTLALLILTTVFTVTTELQSGLTLFVQQREQGK